MSEPERRRNRKAERLLREVLNERFTFEQSEADLDLLMSINEGTYANTKPGDPSFHAYAAAINVANEFAGQAFGFPDLIPFNNRIADLQEEYMPSYPPMSPITSAFFAGWMVLDARDDSTEMTVGEVLVHYLQHTGKFNYVRKAMVPLNDSCCSFYEVLGADGSGLTLWDIAAKREVRCWNSSGYPGRRGEIWYVRVAPPFVEGLPRSVTLSTPYVFNDISRRTWEDFFQRYLASEGAGGNSLQNYLKNGKWLGYWLEFVHQAFSGYTGNMIQVTGVPDDPASLPHADPRRRL
ncbi:MAG: hypothetical protein ACLQVX_05995 [Limisphaerales bacterium]